MKNCKAAMLIFLIIVMIFTKTSTSEALTPESEDDKKFIIVIVNNVNFSDLQTMEHIRKLTNNSYVSLMNTRGATGYNAASSYATLGWGTRAIASKDSANFATLNDENSLVYFRRAGHSLENSEVINLSINRLIAHNSIGNYGAIPGALGEILMQNGYATAVIGNADTDTAKDRTLGLIAMNQSGTINYGDVSELTIKESANSPFGIKTNYKFILEKFKNVYDLADFIVIEMGDTSRLNNYSGNLNNSSYSRHKAQILLEIDSFINYIFNYINNNSALMIITPFPSNVDLKSGARLTPLIFYLQNKEGGILTSNTTRRSGIVANIDIAPTVLNFFALPHDKMIGSPIYKLAKRDNFYYIKDLNDSVVNVSRQRFRVLNIFAVYQMATSIFAVFYITFKNKFDKRWRKYVSYILLGNIFTIVGLLLLPLLGMLSIFSIYVWLFVFSLVASVTLYTVFCKKPLETILYASSTVTLLLIADILTGLGLTTNSILGYVLIIGARYYGIGNEFSGILIAATLIVATSFLEALKKTNNSNSQARARGILVVVVLFVIVVITLGFPSFGANVGATITACSAFLYVVFKLNNVEMNVKTIFLIFLLTALGIGIFLCFDYFVLDRRSHLAASFEHILLNGLQVAYQIIRRKIATNLRIIGITVWSRLLLIALLIMGVLLYRPMGVARNILTKYPYMAIGWSGILVSCVVGFMFNDSGVVIASTSVIFLSTSVTYLIVND